MSHVSVSDLEYAPPGGDALFFEVSFTVSPGDHVAIIGRNGSGKTTILRILAGDLQADEGEAVLGSPALYMSQDVGTANPDQGLREMLLEVAPSEVRTVGRRLLEAEHRQAAGDADAGMAVATAIGEWADLGGYDLEQLWNASAQRTVGFGLGELDERPASTLSGGERKRLVLDVLFSSPAEILLLDEPDNYLDIQGKQWFEEQLRSTRKTVVMVSHDRAVLRTAVDKLITLEGHGCWVHDGSFVTYEEERERRQVRLGSDLKRWQEEERRLFRHYKIMKQRAALNFKNASKANAAETRWKRFVAQGPPPAPAPAQKLKVSLAGADAARRVVDLRQVELPGLFGPLTDEIHFGERIGVIGSNGSGKTHLLHLLAGRPVDHTGEVVLGNRTSAGLFTQVGARPDFGGTTVLEIVRKQVTEEQQAMAALARYGLQQTARQTFGTLSGGQRARLEILCLELEGHNLLLLDEPTDHLDVDSAEALERGLDLFQGTVVAVSHDRTFLTRMSRFLMVLHDGAVYELPDADTALRALEDPAATADVPLARLVTAG